jgi:hypothetical protein
MASTVDDRARVPALDLSANTNLVGVLTSSGAGRPADPASSPLGTGRVIYAMKQTLGGAAAVRHRRHQSVRVDVRERRVEDRQKQSESSRKRLASEYDTRVSPRFMEPRGAVSPERRDPGTGNGGDHLPPIASARRPRAQNILRETETQTVVAGGDKRTIGRHIVSLGSKRLNNLAAVVANNPLVTQWSNAHVSFVTTQSPRVAPTGQQLPSPTNARRPHSPPTVGASSGAPGHVIKGIANLTSSMQIGVPEGGGSAVFTSASVVLAGKPYASTEVVRPVHHATTAGEFR